LVTALIHLFEPVHPARKKRGKFRWIFGAMVGRF
jgi:hypothetical protein